MESNSTQQFAPAPALKHDDKFAIWSQQLDSELDDLSHRWRGQTKTWDEREKEYVWREDPNVEAVMNEAGINYLISSMKTFCNKSVTLSSFTRAEAKDLAMHRTLSLCKTLLLRKDKYNLQHQHLEDLGATVMQIFMSTALRAVGNGERNFLSKTGIEQTLRQWVGQDRGGPRVF